MSELYQIDSEVIKYADLCATVHNISSLPEDFYKVLSGHIPKAQFQDADGLNDTFIFVSGITKNDLIFSKQNDDLIITFKDLPDEQITICNQFDSGRIEFFMFNDNSLLTYYNVDNLLQENINSSTIDESGINTDLIYLCQ